VPAFISAFAWRFLFNEQGGLITRRSAGSASAVQLARQSNLILVSVINRERLAGRAVHDGRAARGLQSIPTELYEAARWTGDAVAAVHQRDAARLRSVSMTVICSAPSGRSNMFPIIFLIARKQRVRPDPGDLLVQPLLQTGSWRVPRRTG